MDAVYRAEDTEIKDKFETSVRRLVDMYNECLTRPQSFYASASVNRNARFNYRPGKAPDGRKWTPLEGDSEVLPWKGASDLDVPLMDGYVNEDVALAVMAVMQGNITVSGHNTRDVGYGTRCTNVLKWMLEDEMSERNRETNLLANFHFERGKAVLGIQWERQVQMGYEVLTLKMVQEMAQSAVQQLQATSVAANGGQMPGPGVQTSGGAGAPPTGTGNGGPAPAVLTEEQKQQLQEVAQLPQMLLDKQYDARLVELLQQYADSLVSNNFKEALGDYEEELMEGYELSNATAKRLVHDLREEGRAKIPVPTVKRNRPVLMALTLDENFFVTEDAAELENARACFWLEWLTEEMIRERVVSNDWDADWAEYVIKHGKGVVGRGAIPSGAAMPSYNGTAQEHGRTLLDTRNLYGILHGYEKRSNEDGVPGIYYTVFHPALPYVPKRKGKSKKGAGMMQDYAVSFLLDYDHCEYPFILFQREFLSRRLGDSRGYGEIGATWQSQLKQQFDTQIDRAMLTTIPPLHHPKGRPPTKWGPGVKLGAPQSDYAFAKIPEYDPGSMDVVKIVQNMSDWYYGRPVEGRDPVLAQVMRQHMLAVWLDGWRLALTQVFQLMQQFLPDSFYYRVVGSSQGQSIHASRDEIQGKFSVSLKFDAQRLDPEVMAAKGKAIVDLVKTLDVNGIVDHNKLLSILLTWADPDIAELTLKPADAATQQEVEDEQTVFARMWAGIGQDVKPGQAYQLRLQVLQQALAGKNQQGEPVNPAALQRYQQDPSFKALVDNRVKQLQFQIEQRQNAVIGRLGATPANN